jgi:hypothetical protein
MASNLQLEHPLSTTAQAVKDQAGHTSSLALSTGDVGIGTTAPAAKLHVAGAQQGALDRTELRIQGPATGNDNLAYVSWFNSAGTRIGYVGDASLDDVNVYLACDSGDVMLLTAAGRVLTATRDGNIQANGDISLTNVDCAEDFDVEDAQALEPGTVMVVGDADRLRQSKEAYDTRVAGVLSGAGDYRPAIILGREQSQTIDCPWP